MAGLWHGHTLGMVRSCLNPCSWLHGQTMSISMAHRQEKLYASYSWQNPIYNNTGAYNSKLTKLSWFHHAVTVISQTIRLLRLHSLWMFWAAKSAHVVLICTMSSLSWIPWPLPSGPIDTFSMPTTYLWPGKSTFSTHTWHPFGSIELRHGIFLRRHAQL